jgi:4,5:9,10-diseco-3-hydroxy-5,9,17-trioxoandrosta-1(10),2-diene-4-oate hydrolase
MMTEFVDDFMKAAGIDKASLVGLSFGGGISLLYALQYPQKVEKLVLVDSVGLGTKVNFLVRLMSLPIIGELATKPNKGNVSRFFKLAVLNPEILNEEFIETYCKLWSLPGAQQAILKVLRSICTLSGPREDVLNNTMPKLHKITASTLIVWGKQDALLPVEQAYFAKERIPNSQLHVFDQCGHMPNFEKPAEFNSVVLDFLTK